MDADADRIGRRRPTPHGRNTMTGEQPAEVEGDSADPGRRIWPAALAAALVGLLLGLLLGVGYGASAGPSFRASTSISVQPDPDLDFSEDNNSGSVMQDATAYIQSQLVVINGAPLADRVRRELSLSAAPTVEATQTGQTYVVQIVATAGSDTEATRVAERVAADYDDVRTSQLTGDINTLLATTNKQIATVSDSLKASRRGSDSNDQLTLSQTALQTEYERLLSVRSSLNGLKARAERLVTTVSPARADAAGLSPTNRYALIGALGGAIVGLAGYVVARRTRQRIRTVGDLAALGLPALLPVQTRTPWWRGGSRPFWKSSSARLLAARLTPEIATHEPVVFVGATSGVGTSRVSLSVAAALSDRGPVLYLPRRATLEAKMSSTRRPANDSGTEQSTWFDEFVSAAASVENNDIPLGDLVVLSSIPGVWLPAVSVGRSRATSTASRRAQLADVLQRARRAGWIVVVEAEPVSDSSMAIDCGRAGAAIALVTARDVSSPSDVVVASELFASAHVSFLGAVLNEMPSAGARALNRVRRLTGPRIGIAQTEGETATIASLPEPGSARARELAAHGEQDADAVSGRNPQPAATRR